MEAIITFLLAKQSGPGDSEGILQSSSHAAHLSIAHDAGFTLSFLKLNVKHKSYKYQFL